MVKLRSILVTAVAIFVFAGLTLYPAKVIGMDKPEVTPSFEKMDSGILRLLIWEGHAPSALISRFEKQIEAKYNFKIKLDIRYVESSDDFYSLIRNGEVDIVMMTHHHFKDKRFNYIENKLLLPFDLKNIPDFKYVIPAIQEAEYLHSGGEVYALPESQGPYGLAYNTSLLKEEPKSWNIFWDPRFKGKYVIGANEYIYNAIITALALGYSRESIASFEALNNSTFRTKLRELAVNAHSFWIGVDKPDDLSGHLLAAVWGDSFGPLKQRGEQWKISEPIEGTPCWIDNCAITSELADKPFLKKLAEEYINGVLSSEYQVGHILRVVGTIPIITNIEHILTPEEKKRIYHETPNFFDKNRILLPTLSKRDRNGLKLLWKEAMNGIQIPEGDN